jgi:hypothetical protein
MRIIFAAAALLLVSGDVFAASPLFCEAYAAKALEYVQLANGRSCGFPGTDPRWSPTSEDHKRWCRGVSEEDANAERNERYHQYSRCDYCRSYSDLALAAESDNIKYACGFADPATWQSGEGHFNFCMGVKDDTADGLMFSSLQLNLNTSLRSEAIAQCIANKHDQIEACNRYVAKTKDSAHFNGVVGRCFQNNGSPEFAPDDEGRFAYCMAFIASNPLAHFDQLNTDADFFNNAVTACGQAMLQALKQTTTAARIPCTGLRGTMLRPSTECNVPPGIITKKSVVGTHAITAKPTQKDGSIRARKDTASSKIIAPGLLEGGGEVFSPQGPSGTGTPRGAVGATGAPSVTAPTSIAPPTVYHR